MNAVSEITADRRQRALAALAEKPDGIVESIAAAADVTPAEILEILPEGSAVIAPKESFLDIWNELTTWGIVLFLVHTEDVVAEIDGELPVRKAMAGSTFMVTARSAVTSRRTTAPRSPLSIAPSTAGAPVPFGS
jgi:putative heme iron utilization protein